VTDEEAIGRVIDAMYAMVSGPKGPRDWSKQREVFHDEARQMRTGLDANGKPWIKIMGLADYSSDTKDFFAQNDFFEVEIGRRIRVFGNIADAWSLYEARTAPDDTNPERRGINAVQFYRGEDGRWRIMSMIWDNERPGLKLPDLG